MPHHSRPNTICAIKKFAQLLRISGGSLGCESNQLYNAQHSTAINTYTSPITNSTRSKVCQSPRPSTHSTPAIDMTAPSNCLGVMRCLNHKAPMASMNTGTLEATKVTLMGVEVCRAKY